MNSFSSSPPVSAADFFYSSTRLLDDGDMAGAEAALRHAMALAPDLAEAHANLAWLLERDGRLQEAEANYRRALALGSPQAQMYLNFGAFLNAQKRFIEAEAVYQQALALDPASPAAWSNMGVLLACVKREREAERCYRSAIEIAPEYRKARFNLAYLLLRQGRYEEGWSCLQAREPNAIPGFHLHCPRWQGEPLAGKSLLIVCEAGHGDMIQFCRYAALIKRNGATQLSIVCQPALKNLLSGLPDVDDVIALGEPLPAIAWDYWTLPLSLPCLFGTRADTILAGLPYLHADASRIRQWAEAMTVPAKEIRLGLVWKGNPRHENDADRSLPSLAVLAPLGAVPGIRCFSLQKGAGAEEANPYATPLPLTELGSRIVDFADTAAIVMHLDLVITVDTAVAHLAGALGKPCWVLLPDYKTDWRWLQQRDDTPWYPRVMRLFRQKTAGDWDGVITEVAAALRILVSGART